MYNVQKVPLVLQADLTYVCTYICKYTKRNRSGTAFKLQGPSLPDCGNWTCSAELEKMERVKTKDLHNLALHCHASTFYLIRDDVRRKKVGQVSFRPLVTRLLLSKCSTIESVTEGAIFFLIFQARSTYISKAAPFHPFMMFQNLTKVFHAN